MKDSKEAELVVAVLQYAVRCLKEGDLAALRDMQFGSREIDILSEVNIMDMYCLDDLRVHCLDIKLNRRVYWPMIENLLSLRQSEDTIRKLIARDAPREMLRALFGLNAREYSRLRRMLTVMPSIGRPPEADEESSHRLWKAWQKRGAPEHPEQLKPEDFLEMADESDLTLRSIWRTLQRWSQYGMLEEGS